MTPNEQLVADLRRLEQAGVPLDLVRELHHQPDKGDTYAILIDYFSRHGRMVGKTNPAFASRIRLLTRLIQRDSTALAEVVLKLYPK